MTLSEVERLRREDGERHGRRGRVDKGMKEGREGERGREEGRKKGRRKGGDLGN